MLLLISYALALDTTKLDTLRAMPDQLVTSDSSTLGSAGPTDGDTIIVGTVVLTAGTTHLAGVSLFWKHDGRFAGSAELDQDEVPVTVAALQAMATLPASAFAKFHSRSGMQLTLTSSQGVPVLMIQAGSGHIVQIPQSTIADLVTLLQTAGATLTPKK